MTGGGAVRRQMAIGLFLEPSGRHVASWRHPEAHPEASTSLDNYRAIAREAEAMKLDFLFIADNNNTWDDPEYFRRIERAAVLDPMMILAALSGATERLGLISTISTTYFHPYHVARATASLDQLSRGRAGWNVVTSMFPGEARNFGGAPHPDHARRYQRAEEFVDVVTGLWATYEADAFPRDRDTGIYVDTTRMRLLEHAGETFQVRGPLPIPRSPQGQPVIVEAGTSDPGRELAARTADVVFAAHQTLAESRAYYDDLKARMARHGRDPESLLVMPGISPVIAASRAEAEERVAAMQQMIDPAVGLFLLSNLMGHDLSGLDPDGPLPEMPATSGAQGRQAVLAAQARREGLSIRQLYQRAIAARGHWQPVGTAESVADEMQERFEAGAADGYNLMTQMPGDLAQFGRTLIPELQRRGLFRTDYAGRTLRENLGLARWSRRANRWTAA